MAQTSSPTYKAGARFIRISPYKVREVAEIIKGKHVDEARRILAFTPKAASETVSKILESAVANAEHNFSVPQEELYVKFVSADEGVTIKRFRPRAQGRGFRIRKRTSHINLELERRQPQVQPRPKRSEATKSRSAAAPKGKAAAEETKSKAAAGTATTKTRSASKEGATTAETKAPARAARPKKQDKQAGN